MPPPMIWLLLSTGRTRCRGLVQGRFLDNSKGNTLANEEELGKAMLIIFAWSESEEDLSRPDFISTLNWGPKQMRNWPIPPAARSISNLKTSFREPVD